MEGIKKMLFGISFILYTFIIKDIFLGNNAIADFLVILVSLPIILIGYFKKE